LSFIDEDYAATGALLTDDLQRETIRLLRCDKAQESAGISTTAE